MFQKINHRFVERRYKYKPVKIVEFHEPHHQRIFYLDLRVLSRTRYSQGSVVANHQFHLSARCNKAKGRLCLGLFIEEARWLGVTRYSTNLACEQIHHIGCIP
ncbi:unnamed protein product [Microthlaspi erraticum]|uniref:Uncharacterized protein n=1 Tax=Microthlaspi erraticum TaxID=1685480 RepID=A0A6D2L161_9BRAS|nr:unnamed protein product [Microthlaspi erraticum]